MSGTALVVSGPSGVGKGTVIAELLHRRPDLWLSVSATTRAPRAGEREGIDYFFLSEEGFERMAAAGGFLEWATFTSARYGTPAAPVRERLEQGRSVVLEIELAGARQIRRTLPEAVQVMIAPPSVAELERRLRGRGTESEEAVAGRLARAREELAAAGEFDHVVVNEEVEATVEALLELLTVTPRTDG